VTGAAGGPISGGSAGTASGAGRGGGSGSVSGGTAGGGMPSVAGASGTSGASGGALQRLVRRRPRSAFHRQIRELHRARSLEVGVRQDRLRDPELERRNRDQQRGDEGEKRR
jgi:hypothetical protein